MAEFLITIPRERYERLVDLLDKVENQEIEREEAIETLCRLADLRVMPGPKDHLRIVMEPESRKIMFT